VNILAGIKNILKNPPPEKLSRSFYGDQPGGRKKSFPV